MRTRETSAWAPLADRVALITGAGGGLGRSIALELAGQGAAVVICDLDRAGRGLAESAELIARRGGRCVDCVADVRSATDLEHAVDLGRTSFGHLDVLVANAGIVRAAPLLELRPEDWQETIDVDLTGVFNSIRAAAPAMVARGDGRIVVISSVSGRHGQPRLGAYNAAKWGVIGLIKAAALELGPAGVTVNAVCPGTIDTPLIHHPHAPSDFMPEVEQPSWEDLLQLLRSWNAMGVPWVDPAEVAAAVAFLVGEEAKQISGATLDIAAGWNARYAG